MRNLPEAFLRARLVALFLLSLSAVYGVTLGWSPRTLREPASIAWPVSLVLATLGGAILMDRLFAFVDRVGRSRLQLLGWVTYGFLLLLVILGVMSGARGQGSVRVGAGAMRFAQVAFLLFAGLGRGYIGAIVNAFALTCVAALAGGAAAAMAVASHAGMLVFFLVADHHARLLADYPVESPPESGPILIRALGGAGALTAAISIFFYFVPCLPYAPLMGPSGAAHSLPSEQVWGLLRDLVGLMVLAGLALWLVLRLSGGRGRDAGEVLSQRVGARRAIEPLPPAAPPPDVPDPRGWRARIVKLYVRLAERLSRQGLRRKPTQTPREFAQALAPASAAESLTELFMRARYGDRELGEADFNAASSAGEQILAHFRGRR